MSSETIKLLHSGRIAVFRDTLAGEVCDSPCNTCALSGQHDAIYDIGQMSVDCGHAPCLVKPWSIGGFWNVKEVLS